MEEDAPLKQVALAMERLGKASRLFADIRIGVDQLLEVVINLSEQETKTAMDLIVKADSSIRRHFQDLLILGKKLEEFGVLNESLRSRGDSWGLHMPLVCPDGAVVAYAWKRQLAGQAGASAVDRTRLALKAFTDQKKRLFSHLEDESYSQTCGSDFGILKKPFSQGHNDSCDEHKILSDVLFSLQKEAPYVNIFTYRRLEWRKRASSLTNVKIIDSLKEQNSLGSVSMNEVAIIEICVPSVFRAFISLHPAGSTNPDSVAFFSPDEEGNHIHPNGKSLFHVFKYIKEHADRALQYFCGVNHDASLSLLLNWICSYRTLYSKACCQCGKFLFMESVRVLLPPVYRSYLQPFSLKLSKKEQSSESIAAYHIGCYID